MDHRKPLRTFEEARRQSETRDMKLCLDETIPVLKAHLEMIENLRRDLAGTGSAAGAANYHESTDR